MKRALAILCLCLFVTPAQAVVLWEQLPDLTSNAVVDQEFPDYPLYSTYLVNDVVVGGAGWHIDSVTGFFTTNPDFGNWPAVGDVRLNIFNKTAPLPLGTDDPAAGSLVSAAFTDMGGNQANVTASGLGIFLAPGEYWIGLTPRLPIDPYGQQFHWNSAALVGDLTGMRNPGGAFGAGTDWYTVQDWFANAGASTGFEDSAFRVTGAVVPEPTTLWVLGSALAVMAGVRARRKRRSS
jgi:hypothetical protein